jgi:hypothetical protein
LAQIEIIDFLKNNTGNYYTEKQISQGIKKGTCHHLLKRLSSHPPSGFMYKKIFDEHRQRWIFIYKWKKCDLKGLILQRIFRR